MGMLESVLRSYSTQDLLEKTHYGYIWCYLIRFVSMYLYLYYTLNLNVYRAVRRIILCALLCSYYKFCSGETYSEVFFHWKLRD